MLILWEFLICIGQLVIDFEAFQLLGMKLDAELFESDGVRILLEEYLQIRIFGNLFELARHHHLHDLALLILEASHDYYEPTGYF